MKKRTTGEGLVVNYKIWLTLIILCGFGILMVCSASSYECATAKEYNYDALYLMKRQLFFMIAGIALAFALQFVNYNLLKYLSVAAYLAAIVCIFMLKTKYGVAVNGAVRWLNFNGLQFQVAEVVKLAEIVFLAGMIQFLKKQRFKDVPITFATWITGGILAGLLYTISNDLSSSVVVLGIAYGISFVTTKTVKLHLGIAAAAVIAVGLYVWYIWNNMPTPAEIDDMPFRVARIAAWLDPERYASGKGYQVLQSLYAIGRGGLFGQGIGNSIQKLGPIPEAQNDMIFSIICEELGMIGAAVLLILFVCLLFQIVRIAISAENIFGAVLALGVFFHIGIQTIINVAVNVNVFPNTGIALPFISYGGTSVFILLLEMAMVFSVGRRIGLIKPLSKKKRKKLEMNEGEQE